MFHLLEFSLSPFMPSFIFLSLSLAFLLCNMFLVLISPRSDNGSSLVVITAIRFTFSFMSGKVDHVAALLAAPTV